MRKELQERDDGMKELSDAVRAKKERDVTDQNERDITDQKEGDMGRAGKYVGRIGTDVEGEMQKIKSMNFGSSLFEDMSIDSTIMSMEMTMLKRV